MKDTIVFNYFEDNQEENIRKIASHFQIDIMDLKTYMDGFENKEDITTSEFIERFMINLSLYDVSKVEILCKHMTTTTQEGIKDIKTLGLLDLRNMLITDTILSRFLSENDVVVDVDNRELKVDNIEYEITITEDNCQRCVENREKECGKFDICELRERMDSLGRKLYELDATVEFFIAGTIKMMKSYSSLHCCPEILETLEPILGSIKVLTDRKDYFQLKYKWGKQKIQTYIVEFLVRLEDMEAYCPMDYKGAYYEIESALKISGYDYDDYIEKRISNCIFQNMKIIDWFLHICNDDIECGSLLKGLTVPMKRIEGILEC